MTKKKQQQNDMLPRDMWVWFGHTIRRSTTYHTPVRDMRLVPNTIHTNGMRMFVGIQLFDTLDALSAFLHAERASIETAMHLIESGVIHEDERVKA